MPSIDAPVETGAIHRRALAANAGFVFLSVAVGGLSAELLQIWALQVLNFTPGQIGLTFGMMVISIPLQLRAVSWVNRVGQRRAMRLGYAGIACGLLAFQVVALLNQRGYQNASFIVFIAAVVFIEVCVSCSWGTAWFSWVGTFTTAQDRPNFLRRMRLSTQFVYALGVFSFSLLLGSDPRPWHFQVLYLILLAYVITAFRVFGQLPPGSASDEPRAGDLREAVRDRRLLFTMILVFVQSIIAVPLVVSWLLLRGYPASVVGVGSAVQSVVTIGTLIVLRPALSTWPPVRTLRVFGTVGALASLLWLTLPTYSGAWSTTHYLGLMLLTSFAASGIGLGWQAILFDLIPEEFATAGFALTDLITSSSAQLYALLVGLVLGASIGLTFLGIPGTSAFMAFFVISSIATAVVVFVCTRQAASMSREVADQDD